MSKSRGEVDLSDFRDGGMWRARSSPARLEVPSRFKFLARMEQRSGDNVRFSTFGELADLEHTSDIGEL